MINQTLEKMRTLRLPGMLCGYEAMLHGKNKIKMSNDEFIAYLINNEYEDRKEKRIHRLTKKASFKLLASLGEIDTSSSRGFDRQTLLRLTELDWVKRAENILITGATGSGKTFIANALGHHACIGGVTVSYFMVNKLFRKYKESNVEMNVSKLLRDIEKTQLLILDDLGLNPIDKSMCRFLFEIIDDRYDKHSTIIASQFPVNLWVKFFEDKTLADAILDRVIHNAHRITLNSGKQSKRAEKKVVNNSGL